MFHVVNLILAADVVKRVNKKLPYSSGVRFVGFPPIRTTGPRLFLYGPSQKLNKRVQSCSPNVAGTNRNSDLKKVQ